MFSKSTEDLKQSMSRNELVSFINLFAKLSKSVNDVQMVNTRIKSAHHKFFMKKIRCIGYIGIAGVIITLMILNFANAEEEKYIDKEKKDKNRGNKNKLNEVKKEVKSLKKKKD